MATNYNYFGNLVTSGLVLDLDAAKIDSYPGSGTTWRDISGNNNNGTLTNGPTFSGIGKQASIVFDGVDDYVEAPNNPSINLTETGGAINTWIKTNTSATSSINGNLVAKTDVYSNGYWLVKYYDKVRISLFGTGNLEMVGVRSITDNIWHHIVATWTSTQLTIYIDGTLDKTQSYNFTFTTSADLLYIGRQKTAGEGFFKGNISNVQIYNRTLSPAEVLQNYNATKGRYGI
jgi:hypothetical protein